MMKLEDKPITKLIAQAASEGRFNKSKQMSSQNALEEGKARVAPKKMSKGGATHKMPDGTMMKGAVHKAASGKYIEKKKKVKSGSSASKRADGICSKGKTKGRMV